MFGCINISKPCLLNKQTVAHSRQRACGAAVRCVAMVTHCAGGVSLMLLIEC